MSFRSSYVTEYIYCPTCFEAVRDALSGDLGGWVGPACSPMRRADGEGGTAPILAGAIRELAQGCEYLLLEQLQDELGPKLCHSVRVIVVMEGSADKPHVVIWDPADSVREYQPQ